PLRSTQGCGGRSGPWSLASLSSWRRDSSESRASRSRFRGSHPKRRARALDAWPTSSSSRRLYAEMQPDRFHDRPNGFDRRVPVLGEGSIQVLTVQCRFLGDTAEAVRSYDVADRNNECFASFVGRSSYIGRSVCSVAQPLLEARCVADCSTGL